MLPDDNSSIYNLYEAILLGVTFFYILNISWKVFIQTRVQIYLIDNEKNNTNLTKETMYKMFDNDESQPSCWRRLFIANELTKLFTQRYVNIELTYFIALLIL